ncbi:uncharacterized protein TNCV_4367081 [Trichonephila clavipes]|nr:uncharacterized protein TNCV_4367081 [Trichonephila clavipes]
MKVKKVLSGVAGLEIVTTLALSSRLGPFRHPPVASSGLLLYAFWGSLQLGSPVYRIIDMADTEVATPLLEVSEELGIAQSVISRLWQRFQDDGNLSRCYSTGRPELQRQMRTGISQLLPKETDRAQHKTCLVSSLQLLVRQFQGRPCTDA